jgi:ABC-type methionine transport system permease subunit
MAGAAVQTDQTQARVLRDLLQETDAAIIKISEAQGATGMRIVRGTA